MRSRGVADRPSASPGEDAKGLVALAMTANEIRRDVLETLWRVGSGHPGSSLSMVEILVALYFRTLRVRPSDPSWPERDRFILSKGHGALGLYATLSRAGFFPRDELFTFESLGSRLQGHPDARLTPGVEMSTGSLGQGLSVACGMALGAKLSGADFRSYCLLGDGETEEGNVWEAAMAAAKFQLDNLVAIVDWNRLQGGVTAIVMPSLEPFGDKWRAFGWHVIDVDGHDLAALLDAFRQARAVVRQPVVLVAHTTKGRGISYMENDPAWHSGVVTDELYAQARAELEVERSRLARGFAT